MTLATYIKLFSCLSLYPSLQKWTRHFVLRCDRCFACWSKSIRDYQGSLKINLYISLLDLLFQEGPLKGMRHMCKSMNKLHVQNAQLSNVLRRECSLTTPLTCSFLVSWFFNFNACRIQVTWRRSIGGEVIKNGANRMELSSSSRVT